MLLLFVLPEDVEAEEKEGRKVALWLLLLPRRKNLGVCGWLRFSVEDFFMPMRGVHDGGNCIVVFDKMELVVAWSNVRAEWADERGIDVPMLLPQSVAW